MEFTPGPTGVNVRVTFGSEPTHSIEQRASREKKVPVVTGKANAEVAQQAGWQAILSNLACYVETNAA